MNLDREIGKKGMSKGLTLNRIAADLRKLIPLSQPLDQATSHLLHGKTMHRPILEYYMHRNSGE